MGVIILNRGTRPECVLGKDRDMSLAEFQKETGYYDIHYDKDDLESPDFLFDTVLGFWNPAIYRLSDTIYAASYVFKKDRYEIELFNEIRQVLRLSPKEPLPSESEQMYATRCLADKRTPLLAGYPILYDKGTRNPESHEIDCFRSFYEFMLNVGLEDNEIFYIHALQAE